MRRIPDQRRVAVVTGVTSGIGRSVALHLLKCGFRVYGGARRRGRLDALSGEGVHALELDVTDDISSSSFIRTIMEREGRIDLLVNNAGYGVYGAVEDVAIESGKEQFEVNLFGLARMSRLVIPAMRAAGSGRIFNISSMGGKIYLPLGGWYHASKFAVEGLSDCMRAELKPFGIDVVLIEPGAIKSEWDGIALKNLSAVSAGGPYEALVSGLSRVFSGSYRRGASPDVIGRLVARLSFKKRCRARYAAPADAKVYIFLRKILSDKVFDRMLRAIIGY